MSLQTSEYSHVTSAKFLQDDAEKLRKIENQSTDLIVSKDLFEHLERPKEVAQRISHFLKSGGVGARNHLRKEKFVLPGYLNKRRASDYIKMFKEYFPTVFFESGSFTHLQASARDLIE